MNKDRKKQILAGAALALEIVGLLLFLNARIDTLLDSDMASEMVLGQLLSKSNVLLSTHWYYSTELRVLNTQIFYALFFKLSNKWHFVRLAATFCLLGVMIVSYYFLCCQLGCKKYFLLTALLLAAPLSEEYFEFVLVGAYYFPHISIAFSALALNEIYMGARLECKKLWLAVSALLALVAGLGGPREIFALYGPIGVVAVLEWLADRKNGLRIRQFFYAAVVGGAALIGYLLNTQVLAKIFHFQNWAGQLQLSLTDLGRLRWIFGSTFALFGAGGTGWIYAITCVLSVVMILLTVGCVIYAFTHTVSDGYRRLAGYTIMAYILYFSLYVFTNMGFRPRYGLLYTVMSVPLFACALNEVQWNERWKKGVIFGLLIMTAIACVLLLFRVSRQDENAEKREAAEKLMTEGYYNGYAAFWNANILTELSNGKIEVWDWSDGEKNGVPLSEHGPDVDEMYKWLQPVSHDTERPSGKVFVLLSREQFEDSPWRENLHPEDVIYESDGYIAWGYPDYDTMKATLEKGLQE